MLLVVEATSLSLPFNGTSQYLCPLIISLSDKKSLKVALVSKNKITRYIPDCIDVFYESNNFLSNLQYLLWVFLFSHRLLSRFHSYVYWSPVSLIPLLCFPSRSLLTIHDFTYKLFPRTMKFSTYLMYALFSWMSIAKAFLVLPVSSATSRRFSKYYPSFVGDKLVVHPFSLPQFSVTSQSETNAFLYQENIDFPYLMFIGSSEPRKNLFLLLSIHRELFEKKLVDFKLLVCTSYGWKSSDIQRQIILSTESGSICLISNRTDLDLAYFLNGSLGLIIPSIYEGYGMPALHATECGCPVYASDIEELREASYNNGFYFTPDYNGIRNTLLSVKSFSHSFVRRCPSTHTPLSESSNFLAKLLAITT